MSVSWLSVFLFRRRNNWMQIILNTCQWFLLIISFATEEAPGMETRSARPDKMDIDTSEHQTYLLAARALRLLLPAKHCISCEKCIGLWERYNPQFPSLFNATLPSWCLKQKFERTKFTLSEKIYKGRSTEIPTSSAHGDWNVPLGNLSLNFMDLKFLLNNNSNYFWKSLDSLR